jgi:HPt (histidine-containing phosphotransfer) domain-containing protein
LYRDLLCQFAARQGAAGVQIASAFENGDHNLAERLAHSIKGIAGNLGINCIFHLAGKLERSLREANEDVPLLLKEITSELDRQVPAIQRALKAESPDQRREGDDWILDPALARALVGRLRALLEASDADAPAAYVNLKDVLRGAVDETKMDTLGAAINLFDFEAALIKLKEIAEALSINRR